MKKTIALAAALMTLLASGCGRIDEEADHTEGNAPEAEVSAVTPVSDSSGSSSGSESKENTDNTENTEETRKDGAAGYLGTYINDKNCVIISGFHLFYEVRTV